MSKKLVVVVVVKAQGYLNYVLNYRHAQTKPLNAKSRGTPGSKPKACSLFAMA